MPEVTSVTVTTSPSRVARLISGSIRRWMMSLAMTRNFACLQPGHRDVGDDPARFVQPLGVRRACPARPVTSLADSWLSTAAASGPCTIELGHQAHVDHAHRLADRRVLAPDDRVRARRR